MCRSDPNLLLHVCCAPCASSVVERLVPRFAVELFFYNPNIYPKDEYERRRADFDKLSGSLGIFAMTGAYDSNRWHDEVRGLELQPEGGLRCGKCFSMRLETTARLAKEKGCGLFATTLTVSPHKNAAKINKIGQELSEKYSVNFLAEDFKKRDGFRRSCELSRKAGFYRQNYCGCEYSMSAPLVAKPFRVQH